MEKQFDDIDRIYADLFITQVMSKENARMLMTIDLLAKDMQRDLYAIDYANAQD